MPPNIQISGGYVWVIQPKKICGYVIFVFKINIDNNVGGLDGGCRLCNVHNDTLKTPQLDFSLCTRIVVDT